MARRAATPEEMAGATRERIGINVRRNDNDSARGALAIWRAYRIDA